MKFFAIYEVGDSMPVVQSHADGRPFYTWHEAKRYLDEINERVDDMDLYIDVMNEQSSVYIVTDAPEDYDGFNTHTVAVVGERKDARDPQKIRVVDVLKEHKDWQAMRYQSGMYARLSLEEAIVWMDEGALAHSFTWNDDARSVINQLRTDEYTETKN